MAIETSTPHGSVALGRGDTLLEVVAPPQPRRHNLDLISAIDALCHRHGGAAKDIAEIYVSVGPGSFTGLRIAVATARMLALATGARLVGIPTAAVLAHRAPRDPRHLAVCLNRKRDHYHITTFQRRAEAWEHDGEPTLRTLDDLLAVAPRPLAVLANPAPEGSLPGSDADVVWLPPEMGVPTAEAAWHLGHVRARSGQFIEPPELLPLYARPPEAVTLWAQRKRERKPH